MTEKKQRPAKMTSPRGVFVYPRLTKPDTKFKAEGEFTTKLRVEAGPAAPLMKKIDKAAAESLAAAKKAAKNPKEAAKWETKYLPYEMETDEDGNETGNVLFKFGTKASGETREGRKWKRTVPLFDAKGKPLPRSKDGTYEVDVWGGSEGYVSFVIMPYSPTVQIGASVSLQLEAAQIVKLVSGGDREASDYGFGSHDDGYTAEDESEPADDGADAEGSDGEADENPDF